MLQLLFFYRLTYPYQSSSLICFINTQQHFHKNIAQILQQNIVSIFSWLWYLFLHCLLICQVNPKLQRFKSKGCPHYCILGHIFNRSTTTGALATPCMANPANSDEEPNLDRAMIHGTIHIDFESPLEVNGTPAAGLQNNQQPYVPSAGLQNNQQPYVLYKCMSHGSCTLGSKGKKAKLESEMSDACCAMTKLCNSRAQRSSSSLSHHREPPINNYIHQLSSLDPPLPNNQYENTADRLLKDKDLQNALMAMSIERRMVRLSRLIENGV